MSWTPINFPDRDRKERERRDCYERNSFSCDQPGCFFPGACLLLALLRQSLSFPNSENRKSFFAVWINEERVFVRKWDDGSKQ